MGQLVTKLCKIFESCFFKRKVAAGPSEDFFVKKPALEDVSVLKLTGKVVCKPPGSLGSKYGSGLAFCIEDCVSCKVLLLDYIEQLTVDNLNNCSIVVGPTSGSVFIRDCKNCLFITYSQQFRMRGCEDCTILYLVTTQPIIESSARLKFGRQGLFYDDLPSKCPSSFSFTKKELYRNSLPKFGLNILKILSSMRSSPKFWRPRDTLESV